MSHRKLATRGMRQNLLLDTRRRRTQRGNSGSESGSVREREREERRRRNTHTQTLTDCVHQGLRGKFCASTSRYSSMTSIGKCCVLKKQMYSRKERERERERGGDGSIDDGGSFLPFSDHHDTLWCVSMCIRETKQRGKSTLVETCRRQQKDTAAAALVNGRNCSECIRITSSSSGRSPLASKA